MTVETGEIIEGADSYVDIGFADNYFSARGESHWSELSDEEKSVALIKGTDFIDSSFDWYGRKSTQEQSLNFPRTGLVDNNGYTVEGVPDALKKAVCVASLIGSDGTELFETHEANGAVVSESVGSIHYTYDVAQKQKDVTLYDSINLLLRGLYRDNSKPRIKMMGVKRSI